MDNFASLWHRGETVEGHTQGNILQIASRGNGREATSLKPEVQVKVEWQWFEAQDAKVQ